jgi:hypothetical protein
MADVEWSQWMPFAEGIEQAPKLPGVYMIRRSGTPDVVYIGSAGERTGGGSPQGLRGRLRVYASGKAAVSGLGEAVLDRAVADPEWLHARLAEAEAGTPRRAKEWSKLAMEWAGLEIRWTTTSSKAAAEVLEDELIAAHDSLWNRRRIVVLRIEEP